MPPGVEQSSQLLRERIKSGDVGALEAVAEETNRPHLKFRLVDPPLPLP
jgi:hypothetical protein